MDIVPVSHALQMNPLVLAFVGDSYYTLYIRQKLAAHSDSKANFLNGRANSFVNAQAQAKAFDAIFCELSEQEQSVARRARNSHTANVAKNATLADYRKATAFEAVLGFLCLSGQTERINEILEKLTKEQQE